MDSFTQIVLGAGVADAITGRKIGNRALLYGAIIGTIPDLDVDVGKFYDILTANEMHRGVSHSIVFFVLLSPLLAFFIRKWERRSDLQYFETLAMVFAVLFTHALLDAFTNWGTQLFWPAPQKVAIQSIFVIDPLYTLPFTICLLMAMRRARTDRRRLWWTHLGLYVSSAYLLLTVVVQQIALKRFNEALREQGYSYREISIRPAPLSIILWNANVATDDGYLLGEYSFFDTMPISFDRYRQVQVPELLQDASVTRRMKDLSEGWYLITHQQGRWYFNDLRFGLISGDFRNPEFVFRYEYIVRGDKVDVREAPSPARRQPGQLLGRLWDRMWGK